MINFMKILFSPSYWLMINSYSRALDDRLINAMERGEPMLNVTSHHCEFDGLKLWIANHPYGSFTFTEMRPSRLTVMRLSDYLIANIGR
jgi:hypothetical protein